MGIAMSLTRIPDDEIQCSDEVKFGPLFELALLTVENWR